MLLNKPPTPRPARLPLTELSPRRRESILDEFVATVRQIEDQLDSVDDKTLRDHLQDLRAQQHSGVERTDQQIQQDFLCAAAVGAQAVQRTMGWRMHEVQLRGAMAAASGTIIQMQTGEGKTVVCGLTALIRTVFDQSVHVATTNDYLAERDLEAVQPMFQLTGTTSSVIRLDAKPQETMDSYRCQITYGPGYLFGFDYLKDQIKLKEEQSLNLGRVVLQAINGRNIGDELAQPIHQTIIVDEADSVLIDESTTPLVLSGGPDSNVNPESIHAYHLALKVAQGLTESVDYEVNLAERTIEITDDGNEQIHESLVELGRLELLQPWPTYIRNALFASHLLLCGEHYVVDEEEIKLVDQNTGRIFDDRTLRGGLHQAVEAKEGLEINPPNRTLARLTRQRFFQLYNTVCGMTGTAEGSEDEMLHFYRTPVVPISPHRPNKRIVLPDRFFKDQESKFAAIAQDVAERTKTGQPILIGTRTINESLLVDVELKKLGITAVLLNGIQDADEAKIIGKAGQVNAITIATNMAGRGTDIKLSKESKQLGGLHVVGAQRNTSRRVDGQLAGRSARQGDPGAAQFFICPDDDLFLKYGQKLAERLKASCGSDPECRKDYAAEVAELQARIERLQFELRCKLVRQDGWMDQARNAVVNDQAF